MSGSSPGGARAVLLAIAATAILTVPAAQAKYVGGAGTDCFWHYGVFGVGSGKENVAFPEAGADYWAAIYVRPPGSRLQLKGTYPHSRFMSFISYRVAGTPIDGLADYQIRPDPGSTNPFVAGNRRDLKKRGFTVNVVAGPNPGFTLQGVSGLPARNDIYVEDSPPTMEQTPFGPRALEGMVIRIYQPDKGRGLRGGVRLPTPVLTLDDGTRLVGRAACDALDSEAKLHGSPRIPNPAGLRIDRVDYDALRYPNTLTAPCNVLAAACPTNFTLPDALVQRPRKVPATFPATNPPRWRASYDRRYQFQMYTGDDAPGANAHPIRDPIKNPTRGFFGNIYNQYLETAVNRGFGKVVVMRGKLPTEPKTYAGETRMSRGQLRFWSLCETEAVLTGRTMSCLYDEQIPTNRRGYYTIVISRHGDRPRTATVANGIAWLEWSPTGDGGKDPNFGRLVIRNLLPSRSFGQAIQRTHTAGDERKVMGPYLPTLTYVKDARTFDRQQRR